MAIKSAEVDVQSFFLQSDDEPRTIVYGKPLTEGERRRCLKTKRGEVTIDEQKLFRLGLAQSDKGSFIDNIYHKGKLLKKVDTIELALEVLEECNDLLFMQELKSWLLGMTDLTDGQVLKVNFQSKPSS